MKGKIPKSTHYDKYGPNGSFTKAAIGVEKITNFKIIAQKIMQNQILMI